MDRMPLPRLGFVASFPWQGYVARGQLSQFEHAEYWITSFFGIWFVLVGLIRGDRRIWYWCLWFMFFAGRLLLWAPETGEEFRFLMSSSVFFYFGLAGGVGAGLRQESWIGKPAGVLSGILCATLAASIYLPHAPRPLGPTMAISSIEANKEILKRWLPERAFVIAPHGIQFRVTYFLGRSSAKQRPRDGHGAPLYRIARQWPAGKSCRIISPYVLDFLHSVDCFELERGWFMWKER